MKAAMFALRRAMAQICSVSAISKIVVRQLPTSSRRSQRSRDETICARSGLFDKEWYLKQYPDVAESGMDPITHYVCWGAAEGRDPNPFFDSDWYLKQNPDVDVAGVNPLVHYVLWGAAEGRDSRPVFDSDRCLQQNPGTADAGVNPADHIPFCSAEDRNIEFQNWSSYRLSEQPTVSAIIPCYNGARWLAEALESIRAQTLPVHEIIVVDDASVDDSGDIARKYGATVIRNAINRGEGFSRNVGLKHASGELIAWLDADDMWMPHHVATLTALLQKYPQAAVAFGAVQRFGLRNDLILGLVPPGPPSNVFWISFRDWVHTTIGSITHRLALLKVGGFNEQERYSVDFDLWLRLSRFHLFVSTHEVTSCWRWHDAQQSTRPERQIAALYRFRRAYWERERDAGNCEFAARMQKCMLDIWRKEMRAAWKRRDFASLHSVNELVVYVPGISVGHLSEWAQRAEIAARNLEAEQLMKIGPRGWQMARELTEGWRSREEQICAESGLFDSEWYLQQNPYVAKSGMSPLGHYIRSGAMEGLDPNPFFDSDWYMEQNPDVAAAGMNPLCHYVRWGAAKGLDPSPLFQTTWYLEQNPDIAAAGVNPLAHYIQRGAAELRAPVSLVRKFFEKLAVRPSRCSAELERILQAYRSPPNIPPEKATGDDVNQVGASWAEQFLFNCVERYEAGDLWGALHFCKYAVQTRPQHKDPFSLYFHIFTECNLPAIAAFAQTFAGAKLLVMHVSHQQAIPRAELSCESFYDSSGTIANLIVIGDPSLPEDGFSFDRAHSILFVPTKDSYESLPQKVAKALLFLGHCPADPPVLKVDDDAVCLDVSKLKELAISVVPGHLYGGRVNPREGPLNCSFWHFGKCADKEIDLKPDGLISTAAYARGQGYWLNSTAVCAMSKIALIHERQFQVEYFEDRAVGTALVQYGVRPHYYDLVAAGILRDTSQPMAL
jgi:glycosyltransferase involved in cell wall biosynthesis